MNNGNRGLSPICLFAQRQDAPVRLVSVDMSALRYDTAATAVAQSTRHGYTGHEMLDNATLIHMNGRIQSPLLGRFLSPDPNVFEPGNPQDFNRYSYVHNNPLNATDPSGYNVLYENPSVYGKKSSNSGGGSTANTMVLSNVSGSATVSVSNGEQTSTWTTRISNATIVSGQGMVSGSVTTRDYSGTEARQVMRNADQQAKAYSAYQEAVTEFNRLMSYYAAGGSCAATASCGTDGSFTYMPGDEGLAGIYGRGGATAGGQMRGRDDFSYVDKVLRDFVSNHTGVSFSIKGGIVLVGGLEARINSNGTVDIFVGAGLGAAADVGLDVTASATLAGSGKSGITTVTSASGGFGLHGSGSFSFGEGGAGASAGVGMGAGASVSSMLGYQWTGLKLFGN